MATWACWRKGDLVLALSYSGETEEILRLLPTLKRIGDGLISFCCAMAFDPGAGQRCGPRCERGAGSVRAWAWRRPPPRR